MSSKYIAAIKHTAFYVHPSLPIFFLYATVTGHLALALISSVSIFLHEMAHASAAALLGLPIRSIELTPMGAMLRIKDADCLSGWKHIIILLSGPALTLAICMIAPLIAGANWLPRRFCWLLYMCNLSIFLMNLLPVYPLDGGRMLALLLGHFLNYHIVCRIMRMLGVMLGLSLIGLNLYVIYRLGGWNLSLSLAGCCIISAANRETETYAMNEVRKFLDRKIRFERKQIMQAGIVMVIHTASLASLIQKLPDNKRMMYVCLEAGTMYNLGIITESDVIQAYMRTPDATVGAALKMSQNHSQHSKKDTI